MVLRYNEYKEGMFDDYCEYHVHYNDPVKDIYYRSIDDVAHLKEYEQVDEFLIVLYFIYMCDKNHVNLKEMPFLKEKVEALYKEEYLEYYKQKVLEEFLCDVSNMKKHLSATYKMGEIRLQLQDESHDLD